MAHREKTPARFAHMLRKLIRGEVATNNIQAASTKKPVTDLKILVPIYDAEEIARYLESM